jgi:hypothetical protein
MKHHNPDSHLTYDELLRSITDASDLDPMQQAHLKSCRHCQRQTEDMIQRYRRLGQMARQMAPKPRQVFRAPDRRASSGRWYFKPGVALGALGVLIFVFTLWWPDPTDHPLPTTAAWDIEEEARFMAEVDALVNDALPVAYQQVAAVSEPILSKDLIDWIVPSIDDEDDENMDPRA